CRLAFGNVPLEDIIVVDGFYRVGLEHMDASRCKLFLLFRGACVAVDYSECANPVQVFRTANPDYSLLNVVATALWDDGCVREQKDPSWCE
ncbi:MAG TPA: hypothetical protein VLL94_07950, partial [Nitrospiraceae bacterium]|nr:hypothetical protein [Nitrospiraceae bacterium]